MIGRMQSWESNFYDMNALYVRPDDPAAPHVGAIESPTHTNKYFNSDIIEQDPDVVREIARQQAVVIANANMMPDRIVGYAPYAITPALALATALRELGLRTKSGYSIQDKKSGDYNTTFPIEPDEEVIVIADDILGGGSARKTIEDIEQNHGGIVLPVVPCYVNFLGEGNLDGREILAAATINRTVFKASEGIC